MSVIIRLQNLPWSANARDIRDFFKGESIPEGGVHIVGGEQGDAFIAFSTDEDARLAMRKTGNLLKGIQVTLLLSSRAEMQQVIEQARQTALAMHNFMAPPSTGMGNQGGGGSNYGSPSLGQGQQQQQQQPQQLPPQQQQLPPQQQQMSSHQQPMHHQQHQPYQQQHPPPAMSNYASPQPPVHTPPQTPPQLLSNSGPSHMGSGTPELSGPPGRLGHDVLHFHVPVNSSSITKKDDKKPSSTSMSSSSKRDSKSYESGSSRRRRSKSRTRSRSRSRDRDRRRRHRSRSRSRSRDRSSRSRRRSRSRDRDRTSRDLDRTRDRDRDRDSGRDIGRDSGRDRDRDNKNRNRINDVINDMFPSSAGDSTLPGLGDIPNPSLRGPLPPLPDYSNDGPIKTPDVPPIPPASTQGYVRGDQSGYSDMNYMNSGGMPPRDDYARGPHGGMGQNKIPYEDEPRVMDNQYLGDLHMDLTRDPWILEKRGKCMEEEVNPDDPWNQKSEFEQGNDSQDPNWNENDWNDPNGKENQGLEEPKGGYDDYEESGYGPSGQYQEEESYDDGRGRGGERGGHDGFGDRSALGGFEETPSLDSGFGDRGGREGFGDYGSRGGYAEQRGSRGGFGERGSRGGFAERGGRGGFAERGGRGGFAERGERGGRGGFAERGGRGGFAERGGRGGFAERGGRGGFAERGGRGGFTESSGRGGFAESSGRGGFAESSGRESSGRGSFSANERNDNNRGFDRRERDNAFERVDTESSGFGMEEIDEFSERGDRGRGGFGERGGDRGRGGFGERGGDRGRGGFGERGGDRGRGGFGERGGDRGRGGFGERGGRSGFSEGEGRESEDDWSKPKITCSVEISPLPRNRSYYKQVRDLFHGIYIPHESIKFLADEQGNRTGVALLKFSTPRDAINATKRSGEYVMDARVNVILIDDGFYDSQIGIAKKKEKIPPKAAAPKAAEAEFSPCLYVSGLPLGCGEHDVAEVFNNYIILDIVLDLVRGRRVPNGGCFIRLTSSEEAKKAHKDLMGKATLDMKPLTIKPCPLPAMEQAVQERDAVLKSNQIDKAKDIKQDKEKPKSQDIKPKDLEKKGPNENQNSKKPEPTRPEKSMPFGGDLLTDSVVIKGMPKHTNEANIRDFFSDEGLVPEKIYICPIANGAKDAYVMFPHIKDTKLAVSKSNQQICKKQVIVDFIPKPTVMKAMKLPFNPLELMKKGQEMTNKDDKVPKQKPNEKLINAIEKPSLNKGPTENPTEPPKPVEDKTEPTNKRPNTPIGELESRAYNQGPDSVNPFRPSGPRMEARPLMETGRGGPRPLRPRSELSGPRGPRGFDSPQGSRGFDSPQGSRGDNSPFPQEHLDQEEPLGTPMPPENFGRPGCVVGIGNVPYKATTEDIIDFFRIVRILRPENVIRRYNEMNQPTSDARVSLTSPEEAIRAVRMLNGRYMLARPIYLNIVKDLISE
ncbi:unnamed protein product, partial [Meganyctiphanes norvegica]